MPIGFKNVVKAGHELRIMCTATSLLGNREKCRYTSRSGRS
jgi:hypothetical protein